MYEVTLLLLTQVIYLSPCPHTVCLTEVTGIMKLPEEKLNICVYVNYIRQLYNVFKTLLSEEMSKLLLFVAVAI